MTDLLQTRIFRSLLVILGISLLAVSCDRNQTPKPYRELARDLLADLVAMRTVDDGSGSTVEAVEAMAERLKASGFVEEDVVVTGPKPGVGTLVARYRGSDPTNKPVIVMAHIDVVDAYPEDWTRPPFELTEEEGFFYGRGVGDNKAGVATLMANFIRMKNEGYVPNRDIIMILTGDEETTGDSINWLANERRDLIDADFALNTDASGGLLEDGKRKAFGIQASEKMYLTFRFRIRNSGGHSSVPRVDNAIYDLVEGLSRLEEHEFPIQVNEITRNQFLQTAEILSGGMAEALRAVALGTATPEQLDRVTQNPLYNALLRTTCVPTRLEAGHADNALPQTAEATVNCRIFPGVPAAQVEETLVSVLAINGLEVERANKPTPSPPSPLTPEVMVPIKMLVDKHFGDMPIIPTMSTGATDGLYLRNAGIPVYGLSAIFAEPGEVNAHGQDEKIRVESFYAALSYWYDLMKAVTGGEV